MGGSSSSKSANKSENVSGQTAISGDNLGTAISGVNNSTLNVTSTDYGAIDSAFELGGEVIGLAGDSLDFAGDVTRQTIDGMSKVNADSLDFAGEALEDVSASNSENLQMLAGLSGQQAASNSESLGAMMELAKFNQDGGAEAMTKQQLMLLGLVALVLGGVTIKAVSK